MRDVPDNELERFRLENFFRRYRFRLHIYDDVVTQDYLSEEQIRKTTERWEMADNLGAHEGVRKQIAGTRYSFADTYGTIVDRRSAKPRIYPATEDGTLTGKPVFLSDGPGRLYPAPLSHGGVKRGYRR
jgi:hypothetical protein